MRAVIDTNLLVSAMISKPGSTSRRLLDVIRDGRLTVILSRPLIDEFLDVMGRPKFARYASPSAMSSTSSRHYLPTRPSLRSPVAHADATIPTMMP